MFSWMPLKQCQFADDWFLKTLDLPSQWKFLASRDLNISLYIYIEIHSLDRKSVV